MINRRSLRIKAFKNLYSFESCKGANLLIGLDWVDQKFSPDLNSMEIIDKEDLKRKKDLAVEWFKNNMENKNPKSDPAYKEVSDEVDEALSYVDRLNKNDLKKLVKDLGSEADTVGRDHFLALTLLEEFAFQNKKIADEKKSLNSVLGERALVRLNLYDNAAIAKLKDNSSYQSAIQKLKANWKGQNDLLRDWYKGVLNKDEQFKAYMTKENPDYNDDWVILDYICRNIIFKNDLIVSYFEDIDLDWSENRPIVRSLVLKTLKSIKEESETLQLAEISYNWEDDLAYVKELFKKTATENDYLEELLKEKLLNWDIERIAITDRVLMKMALAELIYFPSIPMKVTINEFIEISKTFSTPKSKKFVNGILDKLSAELVQKGVIKKSGRGLLDNK